MSHSLRPLSSRRTTLIPSNPKMLQLTIENKRNSGVGSRGRPNAQVSATASTPAVSLASRPSRSHSRARAAAISAGAGSGARDRGAGAQYRPARLTLVAGGRYGFSAAYRTEGFPASLGPI